jgi:hypothetical protein
MRHRIATRARAPPTARYPVTHLAVRQAASLLGTGLLYQGTCHRLMAETLLEEVGRRPGVPPPPGSGAGGGAYTGYGWQGGGGGGGGGAGRPAGAPPAAMHGVSHNRRAPAAPRRRGKRGRGRAGRGHSAGPPLWVACCPAAHLQAGTHPPPLAGRREAYALAAGAALGLVCLGRGGGAPGLADLRLHDRLA